MSPSGRPPYPHVHQINVSDGGIPKHPIFEAKVSKEGVEGDRQNNLRLHGGPDRAICLFSVDLIERMQDEGHSIDPGSLGENLTLAGLSWETLEPGTQLKIGPEVQLEVASYCAPCEHNARWFRDRDINRISQRINPGWSRLYARVLRVGLVRPGDVVEVLESR